MFTKKEKRLAGEGCFTIIREMERYQFYCMNLAQRGFAVVNFTYHLASKYKFPQPLLDTKNIFAVGDSAGAHLLSLYCVLCTNSDYAALFDFSAGKDALPKAVGPNCGAYDVSHSNGLNGRLMKDYLPHRGTQEELERVNPLNRITYAFPPVYIMTAIKDFLRKDALKLQNKLDTLGVPNECRLYDNAVHSLGHVFHLNIRSDDAKVCNDEECRFFREHMKA